MPTARRRSAVWGLAVGCVLFLTGAPTAHAEGKKGKTATVKETTTIETVTTVSGPEVRGFREFCDTWMQKLRERETYNQSHIAWEKRGAGVVGEHLTYGTECTCIAREEPGRDPIGKITYREVRYRREGATEAAALAAPGTIVEQSEVTEIFRYAKGRWQY